MLLAGAATVTALVLLSGCTATRDLRTLPDAVPRSDIGQIHALAPSSSDDTLYIAAHTGVWSTSFDGQDWQTPTRLPVNQDLSALAVFGDGSLIGARHDTSEASTVMSNDEGSSWNEVPLPAGANIERLAAGDTAVFAYDGANTALMRSSDTGQTWTELASTGVEGLAAYQGSDDLVWAIGGDGLVASRDGGVTFDDIPDTPQSKLVTSAGDDSHPAAVATAGGDRRIWTHAGTDEPWRAQGRYVGTATAISYVSGRTPFLALVDDRGLLVSDDYGYGWTALTTNGDD